MKKYLIAAAAFAMIGSASAANVMTDQQMDKVTAGGSLALAWADAKARAPRGGVAITYTNTNASVTRRGVSASSTSVSIAASGRR